MYISGIRNFNNVKEEETKKEYMDNKIFKKNLKL